MRLRDYLTGKKMTFGQFGALIGVSAEAVRRYVVGARIPKPMNMEKIVRATGGAVGPGDFYAAARSRAA